MDNIVKVHLVGPDYNASGVYDLDKRKKVTNRYLESVGKKLEHYYRKLDKKREHMRF